MRIAELLKLYRKWNELTLRELGDEIGISAPTLMRIEQGRVPDGNTIAKVLFWLLDVQGTSKRKVHLK